MPTREKFRRAPIAFPHMEFTCLGYAGEPVEKCRYFFLGKIPWLRMNRWINVYSTMTTMGSSYLVCKRQDFHIVANRSATGAKTRNQIIDFHFFSSGKEYLYNLAASLWRIYRYSPPIGVALILNYHAMGQKPCPLFFIFIKENHTIISVFQSINALLLILQII